MRLKSWVCVMVLVAGMALVGAVSVTGQVNTVDLTVVVYDPVEAVVPGAKVTVKNLATSATREAESDADGYCLFVGLPPGRYELTVEAKGFARLVNPEVILMIGQAAEFHARMQIQPGVDTVTVSDATELIETRRTAVAETVSSLRITNLPINGRNYINFTLTTSQAQRDTAPSIGAAPTSGLNFQGQRARSNQVSVDGADAVDNSVNGIRATVSQEAVQEFQLIMSNYMPEFGRATGGVINIVTKSGSNDVHGNLFGYLRHKNIQARNPFSVEVDPTTGELRGIKQAYTRVQAGATIGGPIKRDKTFYFFSYETTQRQETGFTNIGAGNFGLVATTTPFFPGPLLLTPAQAAFVTNPAVLAAPGGATLAAQVALIAGSGSNVALNGVDYGAVAAAFGLPNPGLGARFPLPCAPPNCTAPTLVPLPASFVELNDLRGNYPVSEGTSLWSARLDHQWNQRHSSFVRVGVSPSLVTGIQVNAQNQNFGQNAASRTSLQQARDVSAVGQHVTSITSSLFNEARFQFARRGLHYGFSQLPGGDRVAINMTGYAFFGREPFSTVDRIERRWQWTDNVSWVKGNHSFKFGTDINLIQLRSKKDQIFELNFGGVINFGALSAGTFGWPSTMGGVSVPGVTAVQAYGLGIPQVFIQGIGSSNRPFDNKTFAFFIQDSWKIHPRLTLNYGVRYDVELTPLFPPATTLNAAAEQAFDVVEGIPRDKNNWSPRFALAWDPMGNGKTVIRAGYGIFFDHPLLAVAFNSVTAEGALSTQLITAGGKAMGVTVTPLTAAKAVNAASIFQGILGGVPSGGTCGTGIPASFGYLCNEQRFDAKLADSIFVNQNFMTAGFPIPLLPFTLHVAGDFKYGYAQQGNLTIERKLGNDYKISASYIYTHGLHLHRPRNINNTDPARLALNFRNSLATSLARPASPLSVEVPEADWAATPSACGVTVSLPGLVPRILGILSGCPAPLASLNGQFLSTPAFFNFFRPSGPNPSFAALVGGYANQVALATAAGYPTGFSGVQVPWSDVMQQESTGSSIYHGVTLSLSKRFSRHVEFLTSWTWSHTIDDSTDLQTLLAPQDNRKPHLERSNSFFDQRHRWVTSAVFESPFKRTEEGWHRKFLADFIVAPIFEVASGRPFTVLTGTDFNLDFGSNTDRPSVAPSAGAGTVVSPFLLQVPFTVPNVCDQTVTLGTTAISPPYGCTGNLGRNAFTRPGFVALDLRVSRKFYITERWNLEFIADVFNLFNRFNVADVSPLCNPLDPAACRVGEPTASLDPRQFQFALKLNW